MKVNRLTLHFLFPEPYRRDLSKLFFRLHLLPSRLILVWRIQEKTNHGNPRAAFQYQLR